MLAHGSPKLRDQIDHIIDFTKEGHSLSPAELGKFAVPAKASFQSKTAHTAAQI
jgi:hypothetical protein